MSHDIAIATIAAFLGHHAKTILNTVTAAAVAIRDYFKVVP